MKKLFAITAAVALSAAASASAQNTTQTSVLGDSGNAGYPVAVQGANGTVYHCRADIEVVDGQSRRVCIVPADDGSILWTAGAGLAGGGAVAAGALLLVVLASNDGGTGTTTTTTTASSN